MRVGFVAGGVGLVIGAGLCLWGYVLYREVPFQRSPEPLFFILDFFRLVVYLPVVAIVGSGVVIAGASLWLLAVAWQMDRAIRPVATPLAREVAWRPTTGPRAAAPAGPPIALPREADSATLALGILLAGLAVAGSVALILLGVWALGPGQWAFSRAAALSSLVVGACLLAVSARWLQQALDDWDRLSATARRFTAWSLMTLGALLLALVAAVGRLLV